MSKLDSIQQFLTNDLRFFRAAFPDREYIGGKEMLLGQFVEAAAHVFPILGAAPEAHERAIQRLMTKYIQPQFC